VRPVARGEIGGERELLLQRHEVDRAALEHATLARERDLARGELRQALRDRHALGQEAGAHAPGDRPDAQVEAGGLDLLGEEGRSAGRQADGRAEQPGELVVHQDAGARAPRSSPRARGHLFFSSSFFSSSSPA
jgi:hypothetical protein